MEQIAETIAESFDRLLQQERKETLRRRASCVCCWGRTRTGRRLLYPFCETRLRTLTVRAA